MSAQPIRVVRFVDEGDTALDDAIYLVKEQDLPAPWSELKTWTPKQVAEHYEIETQRAHAEYECAYARYLCAAPELNPTMPIFTSHFERHPDTFIPLRVGQKADNTYNGQRLIVYPDNMQVIGEVYFNENDIDSF